MAAITVVTTEDTIGAMEAPLGAEPAAGEEVDGAGVAAASVGAVVEAPHLEPGRLPDSAAQGDDEDNQQQPELSKLIY